MKRLVALLCFLALLSSGCALLKDLFSEVFQQPGFRFKNVSLHDASLAGLALDTTWQLDNPNAVGLSLAQVDYALFIDDKQVVAGQPAAGLQIPAKGSSDLVFPASIKFADLVPALEVLLNKDTATWRAEGRLGVNTPVGVISLPLSAHDTFETPKLPQVQFGNPKIHGLSLTGATVDFPLTLTNRSSFPIPISSVVGTVAIAGAPVGTLSTGDLGQLAGKAAHTVNLPLTINFLSAGRAAMTAIEGGNAKVTFDAQVHSGGVQAPLKVDQLVNFLK